MRTSRSKSDTKSISKILTRVIIVFLIVCIAIGVWIAKDFISFWQEAKDDTQKNDPKPKIVSSQAGNVDNKASENIEKEQSEQSKPQASEKDVLQSKTKEENIQNEIISPVVYEENKDTFVQSRSYMKYINDRFGYSIDYPADFIKGRTPKDNYGYNFHSKEWDGNIRVFGYNNYEKNTVGYLFNRDINQIKKNIKYKRLKDNWYVVSWTANNVIYYKKMVVGSGSVNAFIIEYPKEKKLLYDPLIYQISRSFTAGDLTIEH